MNLHNFLFISVLIALFLGNSNLTSSHHPTSSLNTAFKQNPSFQQSQDTIFADSLLTGSVLTHNNQPISGVQISLYADSVLVQTRLTDEQGRYSFAYDTSVTVYRLKAEKLTTEDKYVGVTTFDVSRTSKHILGIELFTSPVQFMAADVDRNGEIDAADVVNIRNFILRKQPLLPSGVWRFIDKAYTFTNLANPLAETIAADIIVIKGSLQRNTDFLGVKMGDVNGTYAP